MRYLKWIGIGALCIFLAAAGFVFYIGYGLFKKNPTPDASASKFFSEAPPAPPRKTRAERKAEKEAKAAAAPLPNPDLPISAVPEAKPKSRFTDEQMKTSLRRMREIIDDSNPDFQVCSVECSDIKSMLKRSGRVFMGVDEVDRADPAYDFARLMSQSMFGPQGATFLGFIEQILDFKINKPSVAQFTGFMANARATLQGFRERLETRGEEAVALERWLKQSGKSCEKINWNNECAKIQYEIDNWIADGALK